MLLIIFVMIINRASSTLNIHQTFHLCEMKDLVETSSLCKSESSFTNCSEKLATYPLDEFTENKNSKIFYRSKTGQFYNSHCKLVEQITVFRNVATCFKDILVSFLHNGSQTYGFLTKNGILRKKNEKIQCAMKPITFMIKNLTFIKYKNFIELLNETKLQELENMAKNLINGVDNIIDSSNFNDSTKNILKSISYFGFGLIIIIIVIIFIIQILITQRNIPKRY